MGHSYQSGIEPLSSVNWLTFNNELNCNSITERSSALVVDLGIFRLS